jgi:hypothetical protein
LACRPAQLGEHVSQLLVLSRVLEGGVSTLARPSSTTTTAAAAVAATTTTAAAAATSTTTSTSSATSSSTSTTTTTTTATVVVAAAQVVEGAGEDIVEQAVGALRPDHPVGHDVSVD